MADIQMGAIESKFADIIWENEPLTSTELSTHARDFRLEEDHRLYGAEAALRQGSFHQLPWHGDFRHHP